MIPYYRWTLRLWFIELNWKRSGFWRLDISYLSRKMFVGKYSIKFFSHK